MQMVALNQRAYAFQGEVEPDHVRENAGFVVSQQGVVVIDTTRTLADAAWAYHQIRTTTEKPILYIINTHSHNDHVSGNQIFAAPVITHKLERQRMETLLQSDWTAEGLARMALDWPNPEALSGLRIVMPQIVFDQTLTLELGDLTLEIIHTGGHTPGHSIVYLPQDEILYIADLVFVGRYPAMMHCNVERWIEALKVAEGMKVKTILPGHGPVSTMEEVRHIRAYLEGLKEMVAELARQGLRREEIMAHPSFPRYAERAARMHRANIGIAYDQLVAS